MVSHDYMQRGQDSGRTRRRWTDRMRMMKEVRPTTLFVFLRRHNATPNKRTPPRFRKPRGDPSGLHISLNYYTSLSPLFFPVFFLAFLQGKFRWWGKRLERKRYSQLAPKTCVWALCTEVVVPCLHFCSGQDPLSSATPTASHSSQPHLTSAKPARREVGEERERERREVIGWEKARGTERAGKPQCTLPYLTWPTLPPSSPKTLFILPKGRAQWCSRG